MRRTSKFKLKEVIFDSFVKRWDNQAYNSRIEIEWNKTHNSIIINSRNETYLNKNDTLKLIRILIRFLNKLKNE